jgi:uncharacterized protein YlxW (UPF0749 family)
MDVSELRELSNRKISVAVLVCVMLLFMMFLLNKFTANSRLKSEVSKIRKELKIDYEEQIKKRGLIIRRLEKDNQLKKIEIDKMNNTIDSLDKIKSKIQIKYVSRIQEIKNMDSEKIKNYWHGQFK